MMRKFISGILALGLFSIANAEVSGFYVGANVGLHIVSINYGNTLASSVISGFNGSINSQTLSPNLAAYAPSSGFGYAIGIDVGYKMMFNDSFGIRGYIDYYFAQSFGSKRIALYVIDGTQTHHLVTLNADVIYAPIDLISIYLGIGVGFQGFSNSLKSLQNGFNINYNGNFTGSFALPINVGVNFNFGASSISLGAKIPILSGDLIQNTKVTARNYIIKLGYTYIFSL